MSLVRFSPPLLCWFALLGAAFANPIAVIGDQRPTTMTAEEVVVTVRPDASTVSGTYAFRQEKDDWTPMKDTHVLIYVPVLLPNTDKDYARTFGKPVVSLEEREFPCEAWADLSLQEFPNAVGLPKGWSTSIFTTKIPLHLLEKNFSIGVKYVQPNFPGQRAGYLPLLPPNDPAQGRITFRTADGYALRPTGFRAMFGGKSQELSYRPVNRQLLTVKLVKR